MEVGAAGGISLANMERLKWSNNKVVYLILTMLLCEIFTIPAIAGRSKKRWQQLRSNDKETRTRTRMSHRSRKVNEFVLYIPMIHNFIYYFIGPCGPNAYAF